MYQYIAINVSSELVTGFNYALNESVNILRTKSTMKISSETYALPPRKQDYSDGRVLGMD